MLRSKLRRMLSPKSVLAALAALTLCSSVHAGSTTLPDGMRKPTPQPSQALAKLDDDWSQAAAAKDLDRVMSFYADDAIAYPPNEPIAVGRDAARKVWGAYFAAPNFAISWKTSHAGVSKSNDLGFTTGTYEDSYTGPDGATVHEAGKYVCVWKKQKDGTWKAIHDTWNSDAK